MEFIPSPKGILNDIMKITKNNIGTYRQVSLKVLTTPAKSAGYGQIDLMVQQKGRHYYHLSSLLTNDDEDLQHNQGTNDISWGKSLNIGK